MRVNYLIIINLWLGFLAVPGWAQRANNSAETTVTAPVVSPALEGLWQGPLPVPGGALQLTLSVVALTGGQYFAALDVPMQKLSRVPVEVQLRPGTDSVRLVVPQVGSRLLVRLAPDGQRLSGTWVQAGVQTPLELRHSVLSLPSLGKGKEAAQPAKPYREENVIFPNYLAHIQLAGTLTVPTGVGPFPAVVLASDLGAQDRDGQSAPAAEGSSSYRLLGLLADYLTRHGVAVLRFDDRGVAQSQGNTATTTTAQRVSDVQAGLNFLRTQSAVDLLRLGIIGHGEGANVALLAAGQPLPPAFVVSLAGYGQPGFETLLAQQAAALRAQKLPPAQLELRQRRQRAMAELIRYSTGLSQTQAMITNMLRQDDPSLLFAAAQARAAELLAPWYRTFLAFDPLENLSAVQVPVLLLSGLADEQAPPTQHQAALEKELRAGGNRSISSQRLAGVNHQLQAPPSQWTLLDGEPRPALSAPLLEALRQWLAEQTKQ